MTKNSGIKLPSTVSSGYGSNVAMVVCLVIILGAMLIPLPTFALDILLACSLSLSISILIITLAAKESLELSTFPALLLFVTLLRLSLNVASTRLILIQGDAGKIIQTFGDFVAGGSLVVGIVIFLILVIIQFVVITKGAERISEVAARFTLDAMPGKQMAIDADLNAGAITEEQANCRREKIIKESEFFGAMDGASKFIRGDAKAGIIIVAVNLIGGILIGYSRGMNIMQAVKTYSILSIGDGLVSQIPSIITSVSSGFLVTKISSQNSVGKDLSRQFLNSGQPLIISGCIISLIGLVPGLPPLPFIVIGLLIGWCGWKIITKQKSADEEKSKVAVKPRPDQYNIEELLDIDRISVHLGVRLIPMVDPAKNSTIFDRIAAVRKKFVQSLGIVMPLVRLKDNINLAPTSYEIRILDHIVATGQLEPDMLMAMDSGRSTVKISGTPTKEPVYGLPAYWIHPSVKESAEINGFTVIDPESVFITHLSETLRKHAHELLSREDVQGLLDRLKKSQPALVGDVIGELVPVGLLQRVLKNLLAGGLPIKQLGLILESLGESAPKTKNPVMLTELVRKRLSRSITELFKSNDGKIYAIILHPGLEHQMLSTLKQEGENIRIEMPTDMAVDLTRNIASAWKRQMEAGRDKITLACDSRLRWSLAEMLSRTVPQLNVIAYDEIALGVDVEPVETVNVVQAVNRMTDIEQQIAESAAL